MNDFELDNFHGFDSRDALEKALSEQIISRLKQGIAERGKAGLVVSGGRTPAQLFERLSQADIAWSQVVVTLADERWVPEDHPDSNAQMVKKHLLKNYAAKAAFIPLFNGAETPFLGQAALTEALEPLPEDIDAVILGMGEDGHTASFFPAAAELSSALTQADEVCLGVTPSDAPHLRMTLTLSRLLRAKAIFVHLTGESKLPVLKQALTQGPVEVMPIRAVLNQQAVPVDIFWAE